MSNAEAPLTTEDRLGRAGGVDAAAETGGTATVGVNYNFDPMR